MEGSEYTFPVGQLRLHSNSSNPLTRLMKTSGCWAVVIRDNGGALQKEITRQRTVRPYRTPLSSVESVARELVTVFLQREIRRARFRLLRKIRTDVDWL